MRENQMLYDLLMGILFSGVVGEAIILIFFQDKLFLSTGFLTGICYAVFMVYHIKETVRISVHLPEKDALKHNRKRYLMRFAVIIILIMSLWIFKFGNPITFIIGVLTLKISAYIQPVTDKIILKIFAKNENSKKQTLGR
jgi:membrane protein YqaA with SNARE-associated domain